MNFLTGGAFGELISDLTGTFDELRYGTPTKTITVAKPYCSPARNLITATFQTYGVRIYDLQEEIKTIPPWQAIKALGLDAAAFDSGVKSVIDPLPTAQVAKVKVSKQAAAWAEYLLLRTQKLWIVGNYQNKRNGQWAAQHGGTMPVAWQDGKPMIEKSCSAGQDAWHNLSKAARKGKR